MAMNFGSVCSIKCCRMFEWTAFSLCEVKSALHFALKICSLLSDKIWSFSASSYCHFCLIFSHSLSLLSPHEALALRKWQNCSYVSYRVAANVRSLGTIYFRYIAMSESKYPFSGNQCEKGVSLFDFKLYFGIPMSTYSQYKINDDK